MAPFVEKIINVGADGNCRFRCVAVLIGRNEEDWCEIRKEMSAHMVEEKDLYEKVIGTKDYERDLDVVDWESGPCTQENWMIMPDFGHIITNLYNRPVHYFSQQQSFTFLPFTGPPNCNASMAFVLDGSHFNAINLKENSPLPPIVPNWEHWASDAALKWKEKFNFQMEMFKLKCSVDKSDAVPTLDLTKWVP